MSNLTKTREEVKDTALQSLVVSMGLYLCQERGSCTTAEIRDALRATYPKMDIRQQDVSSIMSIFACYKDMEYADNPLFLCEDVRSDGMVYRRFAFINDTQRIINELEEQKTIHMSKSDVIDAIMSNEGKVMSITWTKKNDEVRTLNRCVPVCMDRMGYIVVQSLDSDSGGSKRVDTRRIISATIDDLQFIAK